VQVESYLHDLQQVRCLFFRVNPVKKLGNELLATYDAAFMVSAWRITEDGRNGISF